MKSLLPPFVAAIVFAITLPCAQADPLFPDTPGRTAPGGATIGKVLKLKYTGVLGKNVDLADYKGKVVLIEFWATWCPICVGEMPHVVATYEKYHDKGFAILGISLDSDKTELLKFTKEHKMTWPEYFDGGSSLRDNAMAKRFGVAETPCMWLVNKDGKLVTFRAGENLQKKVEALLGS